MDLTDPVRVSTPVSRETKERIEATKEQLGYTQEKIIRAMIHYCLDKEDSEFHLFTVELFDSPPELGDSDEPEFFYPKEGETEEEFNARVNNDGIEVPPGMEKDEFMEMSTDEKVENVNEEYGLDIELDEEDDN